MKAVLAALKYIFGGTALIEKGGVKTCRSLLNLKYLIIFDEILQNGLWVQKSIVERGTTHTTY